MRKMLQDASYWSEKTADYWPNRQKWTFIEGAFVLEGDE